ncbi:IS1595 family transposase [Arthrobacter sp. STN4]|nr:IS1595 family transposase [Arthrobacter sp. STN4]
MTTSTPGISAVQLQRLHGLSRYESAWTMQHRLRRAMVNPERTLLTGEVEVDECEVGGVEKGRSGGRSRLAKAAHVVLAVEVRGRGSGRIRMQVIPDASGPTLYNFVRDTVAPGAVVYTDGWGPYVLLAKKGYEHRPRSQRAAKRTGDTEPVLPRVHRAISNFKSWLPGTHRFVGNEHLQALTVRLSPQWPALTPPVSVFQSLLGLEPHRNPTTFREIVAQGLGTTRRT